MRAAQRYTTSALLLCASVAFAAPDPGAQPTPAYAPGDLLGDAAARPKLSPGEELAQAKEYSSKMGEVQSRMLDLQKIAKKEKDIIKLNCVNDKLEKVKGHISVADQAMSALNDAASKNDAEGREHEYARMAILNQKVQVLRAEAENCIGADLSYVGDTNVVEDVDSNIPSQDVTAFDFPPLDTTRPPLASAAL